MDVKFQELDGVTVMKVPSGRIELEAAHRLSGQVRTFEVDTNELLVDLSNVKYIDSAGFGALIMCRTHFKKLGVNVRLIGVTPRILDLCRRMKLDLVLPIHATYAEALEAARRGNGTD